MRPAWLDPRGCDVCADVGACEICGQPRSMSPITSYSYCSGCEDQRVKLGQAFLEKTGTTWLYDHGAFVLRTVRELMGLPHGDS